MNLLLHCKYICECNIRGTAGAGAGAGGGADFEDADEQEDSERPLIFADDSQGGAAFSVVGAGVRAGGLRMIRCKVASFEMEHSRSVLESDNGRPANASVCMAAGTDSRSVILFLSSMTVMLSSTSMVIVLPPFVAMNTSIVTKVTVWYWLVRLYTQRSNQIPESAGAKNRTHKRVDKKQI